MISSSTSSSPNIVYVLPLPVDPYAITEQFNPYKLKCRINQNEQGLYDTFLVYLQISDIVFDEGRVKRKLISVLAYCIISENAILHH